MTMCDVNKVALHFIEITLRHTCSPVNLLYIFATLFPKNLKTPLVGCFCSMFCKCCKSYQPSKVYSQLMRTSKIEILAKMFAAFSRKQFLQKAPF